MRIVDKLLGRRRPDALSHEAVRWGYRLFLDRDPESAAAVDDKVRRLGSIRELRHELLESEEFRYNNPAVGAPAMTGHEPSLDIEVDLDDKGLAALFEQIQATWQHFGETEVFWSVLTTPQFLESRFEDYKDVFYQSGESEAERLFDTLKRGGIDLKSLKTCLEYGCGVGRVTRWLAERFDTVHAYDISEPHLRQARSYFAKTGLTNVDFRHLERLTDISELPVVDVICCFIVLQHNPPPVIAYILRHLLRALRPGGVVMFQVPTYQQGYSFAVQRYLTREGEPEIEMHVLPQHHVFRVVDDEGGRVIEMFEDGKSGTTGPERSHTFLVQKL